MNFYEEPSNASHIIQRASTEELVINGVPYTQSLLILPEGIVTWSASTIADLTPALLQPLAASRPELVLIGTGSRMITLNPLLLQVFYRHNIGVELMDTPAAARTYNLLAGEGRRLNAGFIVGKV